MQGLASSVSDGVLLSIISGSIYLILVVGLLILFRKKIVRLVKIIRASERLPGHRYRKELSSDFIFKHLDNILASAMKKPVSAMSYCVFTIVMFFVVFIVSAKNISINAAMITGIAFAGIPYLYLRMRLEKIRRRGSFEGEQLVSAFLTNYLVSSGNIYEAIERTILTCPHLVITGKLLSTLLINLRSTGDPEKIKASTERFAFGINTSWSNMLAYIIRISAMNGQDMTTAIEDILAQLREARILAEERKRINGESARIAAYLTPGLYIGSVVLSVTMMGINPGQFFYNQFFTAEGFAFFSVGLFLFLLNKMLLELMVNKKLDF